MSTQVKRVLTRTRTGCWTCRARRKKCDETRPHCKTCTNLSLQCEGYDFRLKWAAHRKPLAVQRKSRNRSVRTLPSHQRDTVLPGKASPNADRIRIHTNNGLLLQYLGQEVFDSLTEYERDVLHDFIDWGSSTLSSNTGTGPELYVELLSSAAHSKPLLVNCLTYQITLDSKHAAYVEQYYAKSIELFRNELSIPGSMDNKATVDAGILLCSISMNRAMPWTFHLNGITSILIEKGAFQSPSGGMEETIFLIGILDLPVYILGRQTDNLHIWYNHCRFQSGIEEVTGVPYSLVDLLSSVMEPDIEDRLLQWPGEPGEPTQCKTWNAIRYAGIITAKDYQADRALIQEQNSDPLLENQSLPLLGRDASLVSAVRNIILILHELKVELGDECSSLWYSLLYPLVAAGSQPWALSASDKDFISECLSEMACGSLDSEPYYKGVATVLHELWVNGNSRSIQRVTKDLDLELGLF